MAFRSFEEFWPHYVGEHSRRPTRWLHFAGTTAAILAAVAAATVLNPWLVLAVPVVAYGLAWIGHFCVEGNRPATFRHPLWSLRGDFRMYHLMWRGRMDDEIRRVTRR
jgi:hypothetical protein